MSYLIFPINNENVTDITMFLASSGFHHILRSNWKDFSQTTHVIFCPSEWKDIAIECLLQSLGKVSHGELITYYWLERLSSSWPLVTTLQDPTLLVIWLLSWVSHELCEVFVFVFVVFNAYVFTCIRRASGTVDI